MADTGWVALMERIGIEDIWIDRDEAHGRCPPHEERTGQREQRPRHWSISRVTPHHPHNCFSCGYSGTLTQLVMDQTKLGLWEATKLISEYQVETDQTDQCRGRDDDEYEYGEGSRKRKPSDEWTVADELVRIFNSLQRRETIWRRFSRYIPEAVRRYRHISAEAADDYDIRWDRDEAKWIIPITHPTGVLEGWQCKKGSEIRNRPKSVQKSQYLFGFDRLDATRVILVESPLDVVYLHTLGHRFSAVASFGAHVSDSQMSLLVNSYTVSLVLALDNDESGWTGTRSLIRRGWHKKIPLYVFDYALALGKDPGELTADKIEYGLEHSQRVIPRRRSTTS